MEFTIAILTLLLGLYLLSLTLKIFKKEPVYKRSTVNLLILGLALFFIGIGLIYNYFN